MASYFAAARDILKQAIAVRAFPAATIEVGNSHQPLWREAFGRLTFDPESSPTRNDTVFDLASLTKVLSTTTLVMRQVERGILSLDDPIVDHVAGWRDQGPIVVTIRDLLSHAAGLAAHVP
jgi:CubicO group peptidase (beta-lactamase class C family)